jgi:hypothetical protein
MAYYTRGNNPYFIYYGGEICIQGSGTISLSNNGTLTYDINTQAWSTLTSTGTAPSGQGRYRNGWGIDTTGSWPVLYVWGGFNGTSWQNDINTLTLSSHTAGAWGQTTTFTGTAPAGRSWPGSALDTSGTNPILLISGGEDVTANPPLFQDGASFTTGTSPFYSTLSSLALHRTQLAFAWDPDGGQLLMFGGMEPLNPGPGYQGSQTLESHQMRCTTPSGPPVKVIYQSMPGAPTAPGGMPLNGGDGRGRMPGVWDSNNHRFIIFGGTNLDFSSASPPNPPWPNERADLNIYILR